MLSKRLLLLACAIALACTTACDNSKIESLQAQLAHRDTTIRSLEAQKAEIAQRCKRLETGISELKAEYDNLKSQNEILSQWSKKVAQRFGPSLWYFGTDEKPLPVKPYRQASPERLTTELNRMFAKSKLPQVQLLKIVDNVAYVRIREELKLTQGMGTTGATAYIESVTYTLTSLPGIDYVDFDFHAGDHAMPGRYSR